MSLESVPLFPLLSILRYIGRPAEFKPIFLVCKSWRDHFDSSDVALWTSMSQDFDISVSSTTLRRTLRSTSDHRRAFFRAYYKKLRETNDKQEILVIQAKLILHQNRDQPSKLEKLVLATFPNINYFDPNYRCKTMEDNTLLTLACRNGQLKCIKLLVERFNADINMPDMGGFSPLILCAYHGNFAGVLYLLGKGADIRAVGKLRSGLPLTAEHWAAIQGHWEIFRYLHALRRRTVHRYIPKAEMESTTETENEVELRTELPIAATVPTADSLDKDAVYSSSYASTGTVSAEEEDMDLLPTYLIFADSYFDVPNDEIGQDMSTSCDNAVSALDANFSALSQLASLSSQRTLPTSNSTSASHNVNNSSDHDAASSSSFVETANTSHHRNSNSNIIDAAPSSSSVAASNPAQIVEDNTFCYCRKGFEGQMIACDGTDCAVEWFHYSCVGLHSRPAGKWYCPPCGIPDSRVVGSNATTDHACVESGEYCVCGRGYLGRMVGCDNPKCLIEWYHFECVNLSTEPVGHWECPACRSERFLQPAAFASLDPPGLVGRKRGAKRGRGGGGGRGGGRPRSSILAQVVDEAGGYTNTETNGSSSSSDTSSGKGSQLRPKATDMASPEKRRRIGDHSCSGEPPAQSPPGQKSVSVVRSCSRKIS